MKESKTWNSHHSRSISGSPSRSFRTCFPYPTPSSSLHPFGSFLPRFSSALPQLRISPPRPSKYQTGWFPSLLSWKYVSISDSIFSFNLSLPKSKGSRVLRFVPPRCLWGLRHLLWSCFERPFEHVTWLGWCCEFWPFSGRGSNFCRRVLGLWRTYHFRLWSICLRWILVFVRFFGQTFLIIKQKLSMRIKSLYLMKSNLLLKVKNHYFPSIPAHQLLPLMKLWKGKYEGKKF